ncbi:MAG TPA: hypothetical protein VFB79_02775 [Candidatus Angelobacter sp.]|nr:hypothetical protein [Candidatus Angelobacter sp.]
MKSSFVLPLAALLAMASFAPVQSSSTNLKSSISTLSGGINLRSIQGAPFSADVVNQSSQPQAGGAIAAHETHGKMFRDSAGRTRSEVEIESPASGAQARHYVTIVDPVQRISVRLDLQTKTATISALPVPSATMGHAAEVKLAKAMAAQRGANQPAVATENLGNYAMQGFTVSGTRRMLPAEAQAGSEKARIATVESWFSPELQINLQSRTEDPKLGVQTTKLVNIVSGEPDSALFQIPADYTIQNNSLRK